MAKDGKDEKPSSSASQRRRFSRISEDLLKGGKAEAVRLAGAVPGKLKVGRQASIDWLAALTTNGDLTAPIERWSSHTFNTLSDAYSQAMDGDFAHLGARLIDPSLHRLVGGHTIIEALQATAAALPHDTKTQEILGCFQALASDCSSVIGLPLFTMSRDSVMHLMSFCDRTGISRHWMIDLLHVNAVELIGASIPAVAVLMNLGKQDRKRFESLAGSLGFSSIAAANPFAALTALVMLGLAFHKAKRAGESVSWVNGVGRGSARSAALFAATSVFGAAPVVITVASILMFVALQKAGKISDLSEIRISMLSAVKSLIRRQRLDEVVSAP